MTPVHEMALEILMVLDEQQRATARTDSIRAALLSARPDLLLDYYPELRPVAAPPPARPDEEPHPSTVDWGTPTEAESADLERWLAEHPVRGVVAASDLDGQWR